MRLVGGLFAIMLAIGFATLWYWKRQPAQEPCDAREISQTRSPDGRAQADVFELLCGDAVATHVALRMASAPKQSRGDVFIAAGRAPVKVEWNDARELVVETAAERVLVEETSWRSVGVRVRRVR